MPARLLRDSSPSPGRIAKRCRAVNHYGALARPPGRMKMERGLKPAALMPRTSRVRSSSWTATRPSATAPPQSPERLRGRMDVAVIHLAERVPPDPLASREISQLVGGHRREKRSTGMGLVTGPPSTWRCNTRISLLPFEASWSNTLSTAQSFPQLSPLTARLLPPPFHPQILPHNHKTLHHPEIAS
jgi:hypothetical protein